MTDDLGNDLPQAPAYQPPAPDPSTGGRLASFGKGLLSTFSGGATSPSYSVDPNTGATVTTQTPNSTGQMFRNLFAGMLSGFAGGVQANANGAHGAAGAFAGGVTADAQRRQQIDQQQRKQAQQQFGDQQTAAMNKAHMAQMTQESAASAFKMAREQMQVRTEDVDKFNNLQKAISDAPGASKIGTYKDFPAFLASMDAEGQKDIIAKQAAGEIALHPVLSFDDANNPKVVGVDVYHIPQSYLNKPTDRPMQVGLIHHVDPKTGIDHPEPVEAPAGSILNKEGIAMNQQNLKDVISQKDIFEAGAKQHLEETKEAAAQNREDSRANAMVRAAETRAAATERGNSPIQGPERDHIIDAFGNFKGDVGILRNYIAKHNDPGIESDIAAKFPGWSVPRFEAAKTTMKSFSSGADAKNMQALGTAVQHSSSLKDLISRLPATGNIPILNGAINTLSKQMGLPEVTNVQTLENALTEELASGYKKGVADVQLQKDVHDGLNTSGSRAQLLGVINTHVHAQHQRAGELAGQYRSNVPNATTDPYGPNFSKGAEAAFHSFGLDNPFNFNQGPKPENGASTSISQAPKYVMDQFMKLAGGDTAKAWELAQKRQWTH